jgi:type I restriction enzyme S subunit
VKKKATEKQQLAFFAGGAKAEIIKSATLTPEAERLLANFEMLADAPEGVKRLRELILELAVRGKLVPQNTAEIQSGNRHRQDDNAPLGLPLSWQHAQLGKLLAFGPKNGFSPKGVEQPTATKVLTLSATTYGVFNGEKFKYAEEAIPADSDLWLRENDILIQRGNTIDYVGVAAVYRGPSNEFIYPDLMMKIRVAPELDVDFCHIVLRSAVVRAFIKSRATGTSGTMPKINQAVVTEIPIPVPPLAEQARIVAKVDHLMALCDTLEARLRAADEGARRLAESLVAELIA